MRRALLYPPMYWCPIFNFETYPLLRTVNVYLPQNFKPANRPPMWINLHGVFWKSMGNIDKQVRRERERVKEGERGGGRKVAAD